MYLQGLGVVRKSLRKNLTMYQPWLWINNGVLQFLQLCGTMWYFVVLCGIVSILWFRNRIRNLRKSMELRLREQEEKFNEIRETVGMTGPRLSALEAKFETTFQPSLEALEEGVRALRREWEHNSHEWGTRLTEMRRVAGLMRDQLRSQLDIMVRSRPLTFLKLSQQFSVDIVLD